MIVNEDSLRLEALRLSLGMVSMSDTETEVIVARAEAFLAFLSGAAPKTVDAVG